jgi:hypothetical protein
VSIAEFIARKPPDHMIWIQSFGLKLAQPEFLSQPSLNTDKSWREEKGHSLLGNNSSIHKLYVSTVRDGKNFECANSNPKGCI